MQFSERELGCLPCELQHACIKHCKLEPNLISHYSRRLLCDESPRPTNQPTFISKSLFLSFLFAMKSFQSLTLFKGRLWRSQDLPPFCEPKSHQNSYYISSFQFQFDPFVIFYHEFLWTSHLVLYRFGSNWFRFDRKVRTQIQTVK